MIFAVTKLLFTKWTLFAIVKLLFGKPNDLCYNKVTFWKKLTLYDLLKLLFEKKQSLYALSKLLMKKLTLYTILFKVTCSPLRWESIAQVCKINLITSLDCSYPNTSCSPLYYHGYIYANPKKYCNFYFKNKSHPNCKMTLLFYLSSHPNTTIV